MSGEPCPRMASCCGGRFTYFCERPAGHDGPCGAHMHGIWKDWKTTGSDRASHARGGARTGAA